MKSQEISDILLQTLLKDSSQEHIELFKELDRVKTKCSVRQKDYYEAYKVFVDNYLSTRKVMYSLRKSSEWVMSDGVQKL